MQKMLPGGMLAVAAPVEDVRQVLIDEVWVSAVNGPAQTVVGGAAESVTAFRVVLDGLGIKYQTLPTSHAFHTPMMGDAVADLLPVVEKMPLSEPDLPLVSAASGRLLEVKEPLQPKFWVNQLVDPVLFNEALAKLPVANPVLVEAGPGPSGCGRGWTSGDRVAGRALWTAHPRGARRAVGQWRQRRLSRIASEHRRKYPLPAYPYRRTEFLLPDRTKNVRRPSVAIAEPEPTRLSASAGKLEPHRPPVVALPVWQPAGTLTPRKPASPAARRHAIVLLSEDAASADTARRVVQRAGYRALPIAYGDRFEVQDYGCVIRAKHPEDLDAALDALAGSDRVELIVHASSWGPTSGGRVAPDAPHVLEHAMLSMLRVQDYANGLREQRGRALPVIVLSTGAVPVTPAEPLEPARATGAAIVRSAVAKYGPGTARTNQIQRLVMARQLLKA